jgi:PKHD-type hydroxylase
MIFRIPDVLTRAQVDEIIAAINGLEFRDGMRSASPSLRTIKKNREAVPDQEAQARLDGILQAALAKNSTFEAVAVPFRVMPFIFSSYVPGEFYGDHVDNGVMGLNTPNPTRADISMTVFLSDPKDYDGGELVLDTDTNPSSWKLPAGHAVVYPSYTLHHVAPVTRGERLAAVTWVQSCVRLMQHRQALVDLSLVLGWMSQAIPGGRANEHPEFQRLEKVRHNLLRLWSDV